MAARAARPKSRALPKAAAISPAIRAEMAFALLDRGAIEGVTSASARRLVERLGEQALSAILEGSASAGSILGAERLERARADLAAKADGLEMIGWLCERGFTGLMACKAWEWAKHERGASKAPIAAHLLQSLKADPHLLSDIPGVSFTRADQVALSMGIDPKGAQRLAACAREALRQACDQAGGGAPLPEALKLLSGLIGSNGACAFSELAPLARTALDRAIELNHCKEAPGPGGSRMLFSAEFHLAEEQAAALILRMAKDPCPLDDARLDERIALREAEDGISLNEGQKGAIRTMFQGRCSIVCGKPGAGKTTLLRVAAPLLEAQGLKRVLYAAPTGKAAKRMSQSIGQKAQTIHRLLGLVPGEDDAPSEDLNDLRSADAIVLDETSMLDSRLFARLLRAIGPKTALILMGDPDQLPSVGAGKVLRDLIDSKALPTAMLTEVMRQAQDSAINQAALSLAAGRAPSFGEKDADCVFLPARDAGQIAGRIAKMLLGNASASGIDPIRDAQVLCPSNKGEAGVAEMNRKLQALLNPPDASKPEMEIAPGEILRRGDKVMQTSNDYERSRFDQPSPLADRKGKGVYNGDVGVIERVEPGFSGRVWVRFDEGCCSYSQKEARQSISLAYACTVHKYQGSETPVAFVLAHESTPYPLRTRNLLYTAITRAKRKCVIMGDERILRDCAATESITRRNTRLRGLLDGTIPFERPDAELLSLSEEKALEREMELAVGSEPIPQAPARRRGL